MLPVHSIRSLRTAINTVPPPPAARPCAAAAAIARLIRYTLLPFNQEPATASEGAADKILIILAHRIKGTGGRKGGRL